MAIQEQNIKLLKSQVMNDVPEGGGKATGIAIADGASNAIFTDVSELDRAIGRVNLRKVFVSVDTPDTDGYFGANVIISDPPDDLRVSCTLFTTGDWFDTRSAAQSRLEAYVVAGPLSTMVLYGNQVEGQRAVLVYQREEAPLPEVGEVYVLSMETGVVAQQFFRVTDVEHTMQTFEDNTGVFTRRSITLTISDSLRQTFLGAEPTRYTNDPNLFATAKVKKSSVADASRYYSTRPLEIAGEVGDLALKIDTIYTALVPSSTLETPIVLGEIQSASHVTESGPATMYPSSIWGGSVKTLYLYGQITPTTLVLATGTAGTYWPKTDDGAGNIVIPGGAVVGNVDYAAGTIAPDITQVAAWAAASSASVTYTPGTNVVQSSFTRSIDIELATRGSVYVETLLPIPSPGTLVVDYMALGKWYRLRDDGAGVLSGTETAFGVGTVNYATGTAVVTLGALPDVGSTILLSWGSPVDTTMRTTGFSALTMRLTTANSAAERSSVTVAYTKGGALKTLTETGTGVLSGSGETGTIKYSTGDIVINGNRDASSDVTVDYSFGDPLSETFTDPPRDTVGGTVTIELANTPILPRSVKLTWNTLVTDLVGATVFEVWVPPPPPPASPRRIDPIMIVEDDGAGNMKYANGVTAGTIDYATGIIVWLPDTQVTIPAAVYTRRTVAGSAATVWAYDHTDYVPALADAPIDFDATVSYRSTDSPTTVQETFNPPLTFDLVPGTDEEVLPNGMFFTLISDTTQHTYVDRGGVLYRDSSFITGGGTVAGDIDYTTTRVSITSWEDELVASPILVKSCLTVSDGRSAIDAAFRTAGAPIRPASLYIQATTLYGDLITGTSDTNGVITGAAMRGRVNNITGAVSVEFGDMVTAAGNESEPWYIADDVVAGNIWKPEAVFPGTIQYNAIVVSSLPLDADIIGLDPVRLPSDGRVPIFRQGDIAVIHHTESSAPQTVTNTQAVDLGRTRLSRVRVIGNDDVVITTGYTVDLDTGIVTFNDITGYSQPLHIDDRIEDMALVSDAQINGSLTITRQLTHDFPLGSFVSSALIIGDMTSRVPLLFDQETWNDTWFDSLVGSASTSSYNDVLAPIAVTNQGAITEQWAIQFTNTTTFNVIGAHVGIIATGNVSTNCAPVNPATGAPYFTILATGWGGGWGAGNVVRFNTVGALYPVWIARTIQQGPATAATDGVTILIRGDIDNP